MKTGKIFTGATATVNQLLPHCHKWAWELYLKGMSNHWNPAEVPMAKDVEQWRDPAGFSDDERLLVRRCLGFFAGSESLVSNNLLLSIFRVVADPECRQYLLRQALEEAIHNQTVVYVCESLGLDIKEVYEAYQNIPTIKAKDDFLLGITSDMSREGYAIEPYPDAADAYSSKAYQLLFSDAIASRQEALRNIIAYYIICEGIFFYSGFAMLLAFRQQNKLPGLCEQVHLTLRDETVHIQFGTQLINTIVSQEPAVWTEDFQKEVCENIRKATELEIAYAHDVLPRGILGINATQFVGYMQFIANRRLENLGLTPLFRNPKNPFPWMNEAIDLVKNKNFFERTVVEYAAASLLDDY